MKPTCWMLLVLLLSACPPPARLETRAPAGAVAFRITSVPDGASVTVDGVPYSTTPLDVPLAPGSHQLHLTKSGYFALDAPVVVPAGGGSFQATLAASH